MKRYLLILTAGLAAMAACQSVMEEPFTPEEFMDEGVVFEACASSPLAVRSHFIDADEGTAKEGTLYWDEGEKVGVLSLFWYDIPSFDSMVWGTDWVSKFDAHMVELSADVENGHFVGRPFTKYVQSDLATVEIDPTDGNQAKLHSSLTMSQWLMNVDEAIRIGIYDFIMIYPMTAKPAPVVMYKMQSGTPTIGVPVKIATDQYVSEGFGKYQLCMDSGFDYSQMDRAFGLLSSEELLQGDKVVFDNVNPITPLLEFTLKCDSDTPLPISYLKVFTDDTPIAGDAYASAQGMAKFLVYSHWADDGDTGKTTSTTITLHFPDATTISSTASTEKYYVSLFPSYFNGKVETFNNDGSFNSNANYREYLQSYGGETLFFEAYDASDNLVMTAQKAIPDEGFKAGHRYKFALEMTAVVPPREYVLDNLSTNEILIPNRAAASSAVSFRSFYTVSGEEEKIPVDVVVDYSSDGSSWSDELPIGIESVTTEGEVQKSSTVSVGLNLTVDHVTSNSYTHARELASRTPVGSEMNPWDLSRHTVSGADSPQVTANCYIVNRGGWYMFPLVYGNAIDWNKNPSTGVNNYAWTDGTGLSNPEDTHGHVDLYHTFQRHDQQGITGPYILQNLGLTVEDVNPAIVWEDVRDEAHAFLPSSSLKIIESGGIPYIRFHVPEDCTIDEATGEITGIRQGNAVIALRNGNTILWSWHIWVTDQDMTPVAVGEKTILPADLGWCDTQTSVYFTERDWYVRIRQEEGDTEPLVIHVHQNSSVAHWNSGATLYQWGRKDPFIPVAFYDSPEFGHSNVSKPAYSPSSCPLFWNSATIDGKDYGSGLSAARYEPSSPPFSSGAGDGIMNPFRIYYGNPYPNSEANHECTLSWMCSDYPFNLWYMGAGTTSGAHSGDLLLQSKTVYDPCPPGYSIPNSMVFSALSGGTETDLGWSFGSVFFPLTGGRVAFNGLPNATNSGQWMNVASTWCTAYYWNFSSENTTMRGSTLAVRPMAEIQ